MMRAQIVGTGSYLPQKVLTNAELAKMVDTSDEWIFDRTGIRERRIAGPDEATSDLAMHASKRALDMAGVSPMELDIIIVATVTPDMPMPAAATLLAHKLGAKKAFAFDVSAACTGSLLGLSVAQQYIASGAAKRILVVGADCFTRAVNWKDRSTCILFGDGAAAMVLAPHDTRGLLTTHLYTDGSQLDLLTIPAGGSKLPASEVTLRDDLHSVKMNGKEVFKFAVRALTEAVKVCLEANAVKGEDVAALIPHQANVRILDAVCERLSIPRERAFVNIHKYGNTSAASLPIALDEAVRSGKIKEGDLVALMAIGAGMVWGAGLVRW